MKYFLVKIANVFNRPSTEELAAYQHKMPTSIKVDISYDKKTGFWTAKVTEIDDKKTANLIITESKSEDGLVRAVNDAVLTSLDFPEYMKTSMPSLLPVDIDFAKKTKPLNNLVFAK